MSDTISHTWQTVEQAAVTLKCSTRTIARRLANGSLESRVDENGRRLVLVQVFSQANIDEDAADVASPTDITPHNAPVVPAAYVGQASDVTAPMLAVLQTTIDTLRVDSKRARSAAQWAWLGVGTMGLGVLAVAVLLTASLTKSTMLEKNVADTRAELAKTQSDLMNEHGARAVAEREQAQTAEQLKLVSDQAKATESKLASLAASANSVSAKRPTTRPDTIFSRLATIVSEDGR
ncbi:MAG: hypothetical protein ACTHM6_03175 [Tepidisphaeraceae bacterium]